MIISNKLIKVNNKLTKQSTNSKQFNYHWPLPSIRINMIMIGTKVWYWIIKVQLKTLPSVRINTEFWYWMIEMQLKIN